MQAYLVKHLDGLSQNLGHPKRNKVAVCFPLDSHCSWFHPLHLCFIPHTSCCSVFWSLRYSQPHSHRQHQIPEIYTRNWTGRGWGVRVFSTSSLDAPGNTYTTAGPFSKASRGDFGPMKQSFLHMISRHNSVNSQHMIPAKFLFISLDYSNYHYKHLCLSLFQTIDSIVLKQLPGDSHMDFRHNIFKTT